MEKPKQTIPITARDLRNLIVERADCCNEHERLQKFLDDTKTGLILDRMSEAEVERIRELVDNPITAFSGPSILIWNNICRQHSGHLQKPR